MNKFNDPIENLFKKRAQPYAYTAPQVEERPKRQWWNVFGRAEDAASLIASTIRRVFGLPPISEEEHQRGDRVADMFRALLGTCIIALVLLGIFA